MLCIALLLLSWLFVVVVVVLVCPAAPLEPVLEEPTCTKPTCLAPLLAELRQHQQGGTMEALVATATLGFVAVLAWQWGSCWGLLAAGMRK